MIISRYKIDTKPMTFEVKKLDMKNSVNEYEIRNPSHLPTGKVFMLKRGVGNFFKIFEEYTIYTPVQNPIYFLLLMPLCCILIYTLLSCLQILPNLILWLNRLACFSVLTISCFKCPQSQSEEAAERMRLALKAAGMGLSLFISLLNFNIF